MKKKIKPAEQERYEKYIQKMRAWDARDEKQDREHLDHGRFLSAWKSAVAKFRSEHFTYRAKKFIFPEEKAKKSPRLSFWNPGFFKYHLNSN
jgi:hypothetical protein